MKMPKLKRFLPHWMNALLAVLSAILLILAFPGWELWYLAWVALMPLMWAVEREKRSAFRSFVTGWLFGTIFFFGTCWWLTFAPITYAAFPPVLAYTLFFFVALIAGIFPGIFSAVCSVLLRRFGSTAILAAPFIWVFTEFLRYWVIGNNWNAIGYSQAFRGFGVSSAEYGGVLILSGSIVLFQGFLVMLMFTVRRKNSPSSLLCQETNSFVDRTLRDAKSNLGFMCLATLGLFSLIFFLLSAEVDSYFRSDGYRIQTHSSDIVAIQPNVPMSGLTFEKWSQLRQRHVQLAELALKSIDRNPQSVVIFPESPMNFAFEEDREFQQFIRAFAARNNVSVLFNSAEPDKQNGKYFNSAVMIDPQGKEIAQYDKIYLLPFGESVPDVLQAFVPAFVGSFSYGSEYDLLPIGDAKAGVMICFESHFGQLSREYVRNGADVLIEMTNDGYLGPTPVLRQHLANAVFRAVETNRPVLRVTNVGITAYINERGEVLDPAASYTEDSRVWSVSKSDGKQTFYVRYGDWFAWLCSVVTIGLLIFGIATKRRPSPSATSINLSIV